MSRSPSKAKRIGRLALALPLLSACHLIFGDFDLEPADGATPLTPPHDAARADVAGTDTLSPDRNDASPGDASAADAPVLDASPPDTATADTPASDVTTGDVSTAEDGGSIDAGTAPNPVIKVMSLNVRWEIAGRDGVNGWPNRKGMVYTLLSDPELDVAGLQEATPEQIADIQAAVPEMLVHDDDPVMNGIATFYRADRLGIAEQGVFWYSPTPDVPESTDWYSDARRHICVWVRFVDLASDLSFYVFNQHWDLYEPSRKHSAVLLGDRVAARSRPDPYILVGDFNAGEQESASQYLRGEIELLGAVSTQFIQEPVVDSYRVLFPSATEVGTVHPFDGTADGLKIDYVYVQADTVVHEASIDHYQESGFYPSDHFPVTAVLELSQ